ncbi:MAG: hypothetical protein MRY63_01540 [Neomegalonema sp.]|nr:hypothetical protein [Neomegalonema sp.]
MSRTGWVIGNVFLAAGAMAAGWFAVNGPELAKPRLEALGPVQLEAETPPLPPAPFVYRDLQAHIGLVGRPLFQESAPDRLMPGLISQTPPINPVVTPPSVEVPGAPATESLAAVPPGTGIADPDNPDAGDRAVATDQDLPSGKVPPIARSLLDAPRFSPLSERAKQAPQELAADDALQAWIDGNIIENEQAFGGHLLPPEARDSDTEAIDPGPGIAPLASPPPRENPRRPDPATLAASPDEADGDLIEDTASEPGQDTLATVAEPGSDPNASDPYADERGPGIAPDATPSPERRDVAALPDDAGATQGNQAATSAPPDADQDVVTTNADLQLRELVLLSVFQSRNAERALVRTGEREVIRLQTGDEILGWRVALIADDHVRLSRGEETHLLTLPTHQ